MGRRISRLLLLFPLSIFLIFLGRFPILPSVEGHSSVSAFFILGDSSVNCGDNIFLYPFFKGNLSSYLCIGKDRRLIPDILAEKMGLREIPMFYGQNGTVEGILGGLNFGYSKATIMNWGAGLQGLNQQLRQVFETFQVLQLQLGLEKAQQVIESSLFYLSFGKDDYIELLHDRSGIMKRFGHQAIARMLVNQITRVVEDLYNANVRKIICMGIGPLGCTPRSQWEAYNATDSTRGGCIDKINGLVVAYNNMLSANLLALNARLPDARIIFCDVYRGISTMITNPQIYGFKNVDSACCGFGRYGGMGRCLSKAMRCSDHVWWDFYNPTVTVNLNLANWTWSGSPIDICYPITIQQLASTSSQVHVGSPSQQ
ncbi:GDSL esterase/lipase At1g71250-like [Tasmannia lanceolata]|uniref:GDSL esterase/lipase At1g71250-like n=1 Tax=Tasmannia lanceolata TaxID=3420 RepID=UPI0040641564